MRCRAASSGAGPASRAQFHNGPLIPRSPLSRDDRHIREIDPERTYRFEDVPTVELREAVRNFAAGLEVEATQSVAADSRVRQEFPDLELVNGGQPVTFLGNKEVIAEFDGVLVSRSTGTVLHVSAKVRPTDKDVTSAQVQSNTLLGLLRGNISADSLPPELAAWSGASTASVRTFLAGNLFPEAVKNAALRRDIVPVTVSGRRYHVSPDWQQPFRVTRRTAPPAAPPSAHLLPLCRTAGGRRRPTWPLSRLGQPVPSAF